MYTPLASLLLPPIWGQTPAPAPTAMFFSMAPHSLTIALELLAQGRTAICGVAAGRRGGAYSSATQIGAKGTGKRVTIGP